MTDRYAALGFPMGHAKSPRIHAMFARQTGQDLRYDAIETPPGRFRSAVDAFRAAGGRGINVTVPFKIEAHAYAGELTERAQRAGAVNCIAFVDGQAIGENFDGVGLVRDIRHNLGVPMANRRVLLLGAGGAARGALMPLVEQRPATLVLANRTAARAQVLAKGFGTAGSLVAVDYAQLGSQQFDLVLNATSASINDELPPVPRSAFAPGCLAYDLSYCRGLTPFLALARDAGAGQLADGIGMLVEQAAEAFAWWRGVRPDTAPVIRAFAVSVI